MTDAYRTFLESKAVAAPKITADDVRAALMRRFGATESNGRTTILFEVSNATGFSRSRSADAVVMWCWPSDGLELHGIEIKVARSDWLSELRNPKKADDIARYCDRWWLVTAPDVVKDADELPPAWGWKVWDGKTLKTMKDAAVTDAKVIDRSFLGAVLRNAGRLSSGSLERTKREVREEIEEEVKRRTERLLSARTPDKMAALLATVEAFEAATGIQLHREESFGWLTTEDGKKVGEIVAAIKATGLDGSNWSPKGLARLVECLEMSISAVREFGGQLGIPLPDRPRAKPKGKRS